MKKMTTKGYSEIFDLSFGQKPLYFFSEMSGKRNFPNITMVGKILSAIDLKLIKNTFQQIVDRHPSLRTQYFTDGKEPKQKIVYGQTLDFTLFDASDWDETTLKRKIDLFSSIPFDLGKGSLMRAAVFLVKPGEHILLLSFHHIAVDLWSLALIFDEIRTINSESKVRDQKVEKTKYNYIDFVRWQRDFIKSTEGQKQSAYWNRILEKKFEPLTLHLSGRTLDKGFSRCKSEYFKLDSNITDAVLSLAKSHKTTINTILLSAFFVLLSKYTKKKRFYIKSLASGRSRHEFENTIGFFVNPIIIHTDLSENPNFSEIINQTKDNISNALNNQDYPFSLINKSKFIEEDFANGEHTDIQFILQSPHLFLKEKRELVSKSKEGALAPGNTGMKVDLGGFLIEKINLEEKFILNDLSVHMVKIGKEISGAIYFKQSIFEKIFIHEFRINFKYVLQTLLFEPNTPLHRNSGLSDLNIPEIRHKSVKARKKSYSRDKYPLKHEIDISEIKKSLTGIWEKVLIKENISPEDSFFELGGHSISAMQIISRIRDLYKIDLPLWQLFENPTISGLAELIKSQTKSVIFPQLSKIPGSVVPPLSFFQERLWFLDKLMEGKLPYTIPLSISVTGPLQKKKVIQTFRELTKRHEILRTSFKKDNSGLRQVINTEAKISYESIDLSDLTPEKKEKKIEYIASRESQRVFDLEKIPLFYFIIAKIDNNDFLLFVTFHHIIMDGMSLVILLKEFSQIYESLNSGKKPSLPKPKYQYSDYSYWQRRYLDPEKTHDQMEFWKKNLAKLEPFIFPENKLRPPVKTYNGMVKQFSFDEVLVNKLRSFANREGVTLYILFLALFKTLLYRYTEIRDIAIGTPVDGRILKETENMIGSFLNILVLRTIVSPDLNFVQILNKVKETVKNAFENRDIPFETVIEKIQPFRDLSHDPLFGIMFIFQKSVGTSKIISHNIEMTQRQQTWYRSVNDLSLFIVDLDDKLNGFVEFNTDLYTTELIENLISNFIFLIRETLLNPEIPVSGIPLVDSDSLKKLNTPSSKLPLSKSVVDMFQEIAEENGNATAIIQDNFNLSYSRLNSEANKIAWDLMEMALPVSKPVAIYMQPGKEFIVAILGVLKSGRPYLPLNPEDPVKRTGFFIKDAQVELILCDKKSAARISSIGTASLTVDIKNSESSDKYLKNPDLPVNLTDPAYIIYTSGSTGKPKGVIISHGSLSNYSVWSSRYYKVNQGDGVPLFSSPSVDFTITSIFPPLITGQKIFIIPESLFDFLLDQGKGWNRLSFIKLTPSHLLLLMAKLEDSKRIIPAEKIILGGEELTTVHIKSIRRNNPDLIIYNEYGPTEATVGCSVYKVPDRELPDNTKIPIGYSISNTIIHIMDKNLQPLPPGMPGEIYIGGACLAEGYYNNPGLSGKRFINITFASGEKIRMYKSGDKAVRLSDGSLKFLGRIDNQIKVRGFRVEPAEIESAIIGYDGIDQAAVVLRGEYPAQTLQAYISGNNLEEISDYRIREYLRGLLPEYMIPVSFFPMDKIPMTGGNKADKTKLSGIKISEKESFNSVKSFETDLQKKISGIFSSVLGKKIVNSSKDFFSLGGHSLLALSLVDNINRTFNTNIKIIDIFHNPTIEGIESLIISGGSSDYNSGNSDLFLVKPEKVKKRQSVVVLQPDGDSFNNYRSLNEELSKYFNVFAVKYIPQANFSSKNSDLEELGKKYADFIIKKNLSGPICLVGWSFGSALALSATKVLEAHGKKPKLVCLLDPVFLRYGKEKYPENALNNPDNHQLLSISHLFNSSESAEKFLTQIKQFYASLSNVKENEKLHKVIDWIDKNKFLKPEKIISHIKLALKLIQRHNKMLRDFRPITIHSPVYINFAGVESKTSLWISEDRKNVTTGNLTVEYTDTDHFSLIRPPHSAMISNKIKLLIK